MPPRRSASASEFLTPDDLTALAATVADGKAATVYLREGVPSLGLTAGASARVISVSGSTVTVKPRGVDDALPYGADELRLTKNIAPQEKPAKTRQAASSPAKPAAPSVPAARQSPAAPPTSADVAPATPKSVKPAAGKPARRAVGSPKPPASVTVTIFGTPDNKWSVSVTRGGRKPTRSRSVTPDSVDAAMVGLADDAALAATSSVLNAAREEAQRRVDELSAELAAAQALLANLGTT
ncbi:hypothetical protein HH308_11740 [Gordonia sp. TBRC 11910]|uniref:Translation initiation factor n=1 Tax=Gordonia asplenii TaxID=2725283 RepID=A0A848KUD4_9ACTN|nr:DUF6319 family protein [Gordonia asplenii]NMO01882.1 hypothetical protein [Gordonia asplenii]